MAHHLSSNVFRPVLPVLLLGVLMGSVRTATATEPERIVRDKTLVAWVYPANLRQRGGSVLTLESPRRPIRRGRSG